MINLDNALKLRNNFFSLLNEKDFKKELKKEADNEGIKQIDDGFIEWFLFEKISPKGQTLIDNFIEKNNLTDEEKKLVLSWKNFVFSIFKLKKEEKNGKLTLLNMVNNHKYKVLKESTDIKLKNGDHFIARLIPYNDEYLFTKNLHKIEVKSNDKVYNLVAQFELDYPHAAFIDNSQKMDLSYRIQALEYEDFLDFFGNDEIIVEGHEIPKRLHEFYHYRYFQKKEKSTGKTIAKIFREKYGTYPDLPLIELPDQILSLGEVGIIYDKVEGLNFLPWYGIFKEIFRSKDFRDVPGYKKCIKGYLEADTISTLPFLRVLKEFPENTSEVFKDVLKRKKFQIPEDFNKIMEKYKKHILSKASEPSVIPMPERTKALLRTKKPEEYCSLHFNEGPNRYKDVYSL